ncbi:hypothetical protein CEXT_591031 [Caerostris extrusa]|uniref:Uncharacterized protein n=1 Tax=Caerostris extrusa TaxID=172846 RepID=A0AAV4SGH5_CAEEX|nr:hypothetical protein CEXT_591031 [Caerostris extrusa]
MGTHVLDIITCRLKKMELGKHFHYYQVAVAYQAIIRILDNEIFFFSSCVRRQKRPRNDSLHYESAEKLHDKTASSTIQEEITEGGIIRTRSNRRILKSSLYVNSTKHVFPI